MTSAPRLSDSFLASDQKFARTNKEIAKKSIGDQQDFMEAFVKIHEAMNHPSYKDKLAPRAGEINNWNNNVMKQVQDNRNSLGNKLKEAAYPMQADPSLAPLASQINQIADNYSRYPSSNQPNSNFVDKAKKSNDDNLLIADDNFSPTNRNPQPKPGNVSTIKLFKDPSGKLLRHETDKSNPNDVIQVQEITENPVRPSPVTSHVAINQPPPQEPVRVHQNPAPAPAVVESAPPPTVVKVQKKPRTPVKIDVDIESSNLTPNPKYDPMDMTKSYIHHDEAVAKLVPVQTKKVVYLNETDPALETPRKTPRSNEKIFVKKQTPLEMSIAPVQDLIKNAISPPQPHSEVKTVISEFCHSPRKVNPPPVQVQEVITTKKPMRAAKKSEVREIFMPKDEREFFANPKIKAFPLPGPDFNKLETNNPGTAVYASGLGGTVKMEQKGEVLSSVAKNEAPKTVQIKCDKKVPEKLLLQEASTNHLGVFDENLTYIKSDKSGTFEPGDVKQEFKHFRHSHDDSYMLWRSGGNDMTIYDVHEEKVDEVVRDFWAHKSGPEPTKPIAAVSAPDANRIVGISVPGKGKSLVHYYERPSDKPEEVYLNAFEEKQVLEPGIQSLNSLEVDQTGNVVFLGGTVIAPNEKDRTPTIYACQMNRNLTPVDQLLLSQDKDCGIPIVMKRFPGHDTLAVGCAKHIVFAGFKNKKFERLGRIDNVHNEFTLDMALKGPIIYSKGMKESQIKMIKLGDAPVKSAPPAPAVQPIAVEPVPPKPVPTKYGKYEANQIIFDVTGELEKVTVGRQGQLVYAGGAQGLNLLKYDNNQASYMQVKSEVFEV